MLTSILLVISFFIVRTPDDGPGRGMYVQTIERPQHSPTDGAKGKVRL